MLEPFTLYIYIKTSRSVAFGCCVLLFFVKQSINGAQFPNNNGFLFLSAALVPVTAPYLTNVRVSLTSRYA